MRMISTLLVLSLSAAGLLGAPESAQDLGQAVLAARSCPQGGCWWVEEPGDGSTGDSVTIGGTEPTYPDAPPIDSPADPISGPEVATGDDSGDGGGTSPNPEPAPPGPGDPCWDNLSPLSCTSPTPTPTEPAPTQPTYPDTIYNTDLIRFIPHDPTITAPNEAMTLAGTPLPISLTTTTHALTGTLLSHPVTVTFSPTGFTLDHGDGTAPTHTTDNPATIAHTYAARGTYPTTITTHYAATVAFPDNIPRPVRGTITTTTPGPTTRILTAHTAPVRTTCPSTPAPGC